jgi:hypothetical protein
MRKSVAAAAFLVLAQSLASPSLAQGLLAASTGPAGPARTDICTIVAVDTATMNFVCQTNNAARLYWVKHATRFRVRQQHASFFNLRTGQQVEVHSHSSGRLQVADLVVS